MSKNTEAILLVAIIAGVIAHAIGFGVVDVLLTSVFFMAVTRILLMFE